MEKVHANGKEQWFRCATTEEYEKERQYYSGIFRILHGKQRMSMRYVDLDADLPPDDLLLAVITGSGFRFENDLVTVVMLAPEGMAANPFDPLVAAIQTAPEPPPFTDIPFDLDAEEITYEETFFN